MPEFEDKKDLKSSATSPVAGWLKRIEGAGKHEEKWRKRARNVERLHNDQEGDTASSHRQARFNILWSNTQTLKPAIFSGDPQPDVRRRFLDKDPDAKEAAAVLERALSYALDAHDFTEALSDVEEDYLLAGRGVPRVRYIPTFGRGEPLRRPVRAEDRIGADGIATGRVMRMMEPMNGAGGMMQPVRDLMEEEAARVLQGDDGLFLEEPGEEELLHEEVRLEYVPWDDFRMSPAKRWEDVSWVAFRTYMTREMLAQFGAVGKDVELNVAAMGHEAKTSGDGEKDSLPPDDMFKRAEVWEVWDKDTRKMMVLSTGLEDKFLLPPATDPLRLRDFFPIPRPIYSVKSNRTMIPTPEYCLYQDQAAELDRITGRIERLIDAIKAKGVVPQEFAGDLNRLWKLDENTFLPIENFTRFVELGGMKGIVDWAPIEEFVKALAVLYEQRASLIQGIYEVTGVSDIIRGASDPRETLGAQRLKSQFATLRLSSRQKEFARLVRDCLRLMAEVIAEHFSHDTLAAMTGKEITPQVMALLRSDILRRFAVDVESDTTIAPDDIKGKEDVVEFMGQIIVPMATAGLLAPDIIKESFAFAARRFKISRELEDMLSGGGGGAGPGGVAAGDGEQQSAPGQGGAPQGPSGPSPEAEAAKLQLEAQKGSSEAEAAREKLALEREKLALEKYRIDTEARLRSLEIQVNAAASAARGGAE